MSTSPPIASELWQRWNLPCSGPLCGCIKPKEALPNDEDRFRSGSSRGGADDCSVACQHHSGQGPNPRDGPKASMFSSGGTAAAVAVAGVGLCWQTNERQRNAKPPVVKFAGIKVE